MLQCDVAVNGVRHYIVVTSVTVWRCSQRCQTLHRSHQCYSVTLQSTVSDITPYSPVLRCDVAVNSVRHYIVFTSVTVWRCSQQCRILHRIHQCYFVTLHSTMLDIAFMWCSSQQFQTLHRIHQCYSVMLQSTKLDILRCIHQCYHVMF